MAQAQSATKADPGTQGSADLWRDYGSQFAELAKEESALLEERWLRAYSEYNPQGLTEEGYVFSYLDRPACGLWTLSDGPTVNFRERFQTLAARAGLALGPPEGTTGLDFWLHRLFLDLLENRSREPRQVWGQKGEGGIIPKLCEASATYCSRLERESLERPAVAVRKAFVLPVLSAKGMTRSRWAAKAGVDPSVVYDYLEGKSNPRPESRKALAEALGVLQSNLPE